VDHEAGSKKGSEKLYTVHTPLGQIRTPHVVHATNGYAAHLLAPMRQKILPWRGTMSAQRPGTSYQSPSPSSSSTTTSTASIPKTPKPFPPGTLSHVFWPGELEYGFDYLTQLPDGEHELMFGGAALHEKDLGNADDRTYNAHTAMHLSGALSVLFGERNWGAEKRLEQEEEGGEEIHQQTGVGGEAGSDERSAKGEWFEGRVKALWSGIMGYSVDGVPWVGRLPSRISGRIPPPLPALTKKRSQVSTSSVFTNDKRQDIELGNEKKNKGWSIAEPGEWISAGYTGEGMVHAWLSGKALAHMILNDEDAIGAWFPEIMRVDVKRWKKARLEGH
jgi:glycine/D-amino acid oxidase-like deaminating enzyme